ncbi:hypothetical protein LSAT2_010145 [Lamellibrachia satsuma]|nr:hypothetical protein LSAT2_010145 [Lamellibrachia satsuma]
MDSTGCWQLQQSYAGDMGGMRETRRSWTTKDKPYVCSHPGCDKSYFYLHALRRHEKQKQHGTAGGDADDQDNGQEEAQDHQDQEMSPRDVSDLLGERVQGHVTSTALQGEISLT